MRETTIYHATKPSLKSLLTQNQIWTIRLVKILAVIGLSLIIYAYSPSVTAFKLSGKEIQTLNSGSRPQATRNYQPPFDSSLPVESHIRIPAIGVDSVLQEAFYDNYEEALKNGIWRASDFGTPTDNKKPMILAAHRYGYLFWSNSFRRKSSFYNLPKLEVGDTIEIVWKQRRYIYSVYSKAEGEEITDYSADLILYTCESLNGPQRIFRYAKLLEI